MRTGKMRHLVTLQNLVVGSPQQLPTGEPDEAWTAFATDIWADIQPLRGRELIAAQAVASEVTGTIRIRHVAALTAKSRVLFGTRIYDILAAVNPGERNWEWLLYVKEGPNAG